MQREDFGAPTFAELTKLSQMKPLVLNEKEEKETLLSESARVRRANSHPGLSGRPHDQIFPLWVRLKPPTSRGPLIPSLLDPVQVRHELIARQMAWPMTAASDGK